MSDSRTQSETAVRTWADLARDEPGTVYLDGYENSVRFLIMRGPVALCAYVGVPLDHPLAGADYDHLPLDVHGGLTFASKGEGPAWPEGWWWYGWDYGHSGDRCFFDLGRPSRLKEHEWTVEEVRGQIWRATYEFKKLMELAEAIAAKAKGWRP